MGLFSSSKSRQTTNIDETNTTAVDNRLTEAETAFVGGNVTTGKTGGNVNITTTDFGALDAASRIADNSFQAVTGTVDRSLAAVGSAVSNSNNVLEGAVSKAVKVAQSAAQDEGARTAQFVVLGLVIVGTAIALREPIAKAFK